MNHEESGIEELRALMRLADATRESAFDDLTATECIRLLRACRALDLETLPDQLTPTECFTVAACGYFPTDILTRLYTAEYGPSFSKTGKDWKGR